MGSPESVPSADWAPVEHLWDDVAEAWFRPEDGRPTFRFRVHRDRFGSLNAGPQLTLGTLLNAAFIPADEVESWYFGDHLRPAGDELAPDPGHLLPPPPSGETHLTVHVRLKTPTQPDSRDEGDEPEVTPEQWQALDALWKVILGLEAGIDAVRLGLDGLRAEMEAAFRRPLAAEEKLHALQADVAQWTRAKSRLHHALPKAREFVHRATWAAAAPERLQLGDLVRDHIEPRILPPRLDRVRERLEHLQKDRQVLAAQGTAVAHECRGILAEVQRALGTLQRNAADRARQKRSAGREKGKHF
ncbi:hypothetical protein J0H58_23745 [bacterium]|nr:hypothetical protein [bacterium]